MNLAFHHFRKEVRHHRVRWLVWLVLLVVLLAVELEWLFPMDPQFERSENVIEVLRGAVRAFALWMAASSATEDLPGNPSRFLAARPLSLGTYLAARVLTFLALVVAPLATWEGLYLAISGRPAMEVLAGAGEAAVVALLVYGWALPFGWVWRGGGQWLLAMGVMVLAANISFYFTNRLAWLVWDPIIIIGSASGGRASLSEGNHLSIFVVLALATAILGLVAWRHLRQEWSIWKRVAVACAIGVMTGWAWTYSKISLPLSYAAAQQEVDALAAKLSPELDVEMSFRDESVTRLLATRVSVRMAASEIKVLSADIPNVSLHWHSLGSEVSWQGESRPGSCVIMPPAEFASNWTEQFYEAPRTVAALFPKGTQLRWHESHHYGSPIRDVHRVPENWKPGAPGKPRLRGTLEACWVRWTMGGEMPLVKGSKLDLGDCRWEILDVLPNISERVQQGALAVDVRVEHRVAEREARPWSWYGSLVPMIHAPSKGIVWVSQSEMENRNSGYVMLRTDAERGWGSGWVRAHCRFSWPNVLEPRAGVTPENTSTLRLTVVRREFMGTSRWNFDSQEVRVDDRRHALQASDSMQDDATVAARIAALPALPEGATERQAAELLVSVLEAVPDGGAGMAQAVEKLRPVARQHPSLLFKLDVFADWQTLFMTLSSEFGEKQRDAVIDHVSEAPWLAPVVLERGWAGEARRSADVLLAARAIPDGVDKLFWKWKDPADLSGLIRHLKRRPSYRRFLQIAKFPDAAPPLHECATFWMTHSLPIVEEWLDDQCSALLSNLAVGNPEALAVMLSLSRNMSLAERRDATGWIMEFAAPLFGLGGSPASTASPVQADEFLDSLSKSKPEDFRFEIPRRQWVRVNP